MDTEDLFDNNKNVAYGKFSKKIKGAFKISDEAIKTEKYIINNIKINSNLKKKCNIKKKCENDIINMKDKKNEGICSHQNKSKYKLINYLNSIKYNLSIKKYFKMLVTVSFLNYLPLHLRNISNNVYISGTIFNLKDPESFKIFLILCKSKILLTYRSNFLLKISNSNNYCKNTNNNNINDNSNDDNNNNFNDNNNSTNENSNSLNDNNNNNDNNYSNNGINSIYERYKNIKEFEKTKGKWRKKEKKKKKRYYKESVIDFTDIPEHFLKNVYFDDKECFYIDLERISKHNTNNFYDSNSCISMSRYFYCSRDLYPKILGNEVNKDISTYSTNDSNNSILYLDNFKSDFSLNEKNKKNIEVLNCYDDEKTRIAYVNNTNINNSNNNNYSKYKNIEISNELLNNISKNNKQNEKNRTTENYIHYEKNQEKRNSKLESMPFNKKKNFDVNFRIKKKKYTIIIKKKKKKWTQFDDNIKYIQMSDNGWGCMLRVVQMILANILINYKISKKYVFFHNYGDYLLYKNYMNKLYSDKNENKKNSTIIQEKNIQGNLCSFKKIVENCDITNKIIKNFNKKIEYDKFYEKEKNESGFVIIKIESNLFHNNEDNSLINRNIKNLPMGLYCKSNKKINFLIKRKKKEIHEDKMKKNKSRAIYIYKKNDKTKNYVYHHFKSYENFLNSTDDNIQNIHVNNSLIYPILLQFRDTEKAKYSIQNIIYEIMKCKKIDEKEVQHFVHEWTGPTSSAMIISNLINKKKVRFVGKKKKKAIYHKINVLENDLINKKNPFKMKNYDLENSNNRKTKIIFMRKKNRQAFFSVAFETGVIYNNKVLKFFQIKQKISIIIWVCLKLGIDSMNISKYKKSILSCFLLKQFQGISSGNIHTSAYYFYSANENGLFYLDPHIKCQNAFTSINKYFNSEFFTDKIKILPWEYLNSSVSLIFVVDSKDDYMNLVKDLKLIDSSIFEFYDEEPQYSFKNKLSYDTDDSGLVLL
ncbi:cysteine protease ATG4, putative [Plasmodium relictum]|uniref:Cysteine protease n=1 Tax=Plasmodium relictum TaxID=85471 RepID=A0A1J1HDF8_PLARL|nr:cysteine protease ATG4, putative [Plasmodium relictum]CRH03964.1 cysteine protease ATG4, putative [Plasmodium relictum]